MLTSNGNLVHFFQGEKDAALLKIAELKDALSESNTEVLSFRTSLTESENKIQELEATLFATQEQHSSDTSFREQEVTKISQKIAALENDVEEHTKTKSSLENELKTTVSIVKLVHVTASFNKTQHLWAMIHDDRNNNNDDDDSHSHNHDNNSNNTNTNNNNYKKFLFSGTFTVFTSVKCKYKEKEMYYNLKVWRFK